MEIYPKTLDEFEEWFSSESACRDYLISLRWPNGFSCERCGHEKCWAMANGLYECSRCGFQNSITAGTIFQDTKKPLAIWFRAMWHITSQKYGTNALGLQRVLGLGSYRTAWTWLHKFRRAMVRPGRDLLSGEVQVDESYIGGKKPGKRGRGAEGKTLVLVAAEEDGLRIGRIRLHRIPDASAESIEAAIVAMISPGAGICTDGWGGYNGLNRLGYAHEVVRKEANVGEDLLPLCHRVAGLLKRWLLGTLQGAVSHEHLEYYLDEYTFRFNRRTSRYRGKLFYRLVQQSVAVDPAPLKSMIKHARGPAPRHQM
jgi:transposase-like protein/ribosomal protein L37AE/L43A|tara:strand:+ start:74 stop:1012 length:939 start_codon:yes stop_codon:yes gene_type:complete